MQAAALRSFCRFLCLSGGVSQDWSRVLLPVANRREQLPAYLTESQVVRALGVGERRTPTGKRNHAILLCLARLGLRASEVAHLGLEDIHWRLGTLRLAKTKTRRERLLPVSAELGRALAAYLRTRPPATPTRALFLLRRKNGPISRHTVSSLSAATLRRAGIVSSHKGAHLWRHTVASQLARRGASLKAIADLLGHADLSSTLVYAKLDLPRLREVALPWPNQEAGV
jgi:site-specific recombinase XerD